MAYTKSNILGTLIVVCSLPFWFFCHDILQKNAYDGITVVYAAVFLTLYVCSMGILMLFAERASVFFLPVAISVLPFFYFFGVSILGGVIGFVYVMCALQAFSRVLWERDNRLQFKPLFLLRQGVPLMLTGIILMLAAGYYAQTNRSLEQISIRDIMPPAFMTAILNRVTPFISERLGIGLDTNLTVDEYIRVQLEATGVDIARFSEKDRDAIISQMRNRLAESLMGGLPSGSLAGNERLGDIFYRIIEQKSESLLLPYQKYIPLALAIGLFLFLRTIAFPYGWFVAGVSALLVLLLQRARVIQRVEEQTVRERFEWT
ncbi:MAG: hypothetical protein AAB710_01375 [Patescibacteria group bacterium]